MPANHWNTGFFISLILAATLLLALSGCGLFSFKESMDKVEKSTMTVAGEIVGKQGSNIIVGALEAADGSLTLVDYRVMRRPGDFKMRLFKADYLLFAYADENADLAYQTGEAAAFVKTSAAATDKTYELKLGSASAQEVSQLRADNRIQISLLPYRENIGRVVALDDPHLSLAVGEMGLWKPMEFFAEGHGGIFFLEPYDPQKIPVVLIHGVAGAPAHFEKIISTIDQSRYQVWLVSYPSSFRLKRLGNSIYNILMELHVKFDTGPMVLVSHSMGGVVARQVLDSAVNAGSVDIFSGLISIVAPWNGHEMASYGVEHSPVVIPCWEDMAPGSDFLKRWHTTPMPVPHQLVFAYRNEKKMSSGSSDGTISLASQLYQPVQEQAIRLLGVDANHVGVLEHPDLLKRFDDLLEEAVAQ